MNYSNHQVWGLGPKDGMVWGEKREYARTVEVEWWECQTCGNEMHMEEVSRQ